jgi:hypothetical protein
MMTTFRVEGTRYEFQVTGRLPEENSNAGYVAVGLSHDDFMVCAVIRKSRLKFIFHLMLWYAYAKCKAIFMEMRARH